MLTRDDIRRYSSTMEMSILLKCIPLKTELQTDIMSYITPQEKLDIINSKVNEQVINKLAKLASKIYILSPNKDTLFCLCMAIGTILKEYEWGTYYISDDGVYYLAEKICSIR